MVAIRSAFIVSSYNKNSVGIHTVVNGFFEKINCIFSVLAIGNASGSSSLVGVKE